MTDLVHVILDGPHSGAWNMAVDEALLEESLRTGRIFLRLYRWSEPTVSLGYFQSEDQLHDDPRLAQLPFVRRLSGGGAILHHHEQTYSCSLPPAHRLALQPSQLYEQIHAVFVEWLAQRGIPVARRAVVAEPHDELFLCFLRKAAPDLIAGGHKVLGSAQRRRRGAVLQHGSLLLRASEHLPDLLGLIDWTPTFPDTATGWLQLADSLARCLGVSQVMAALPDAIQSKAAELLQQPCTSGSLKAQLLKESTFQNSPD